MRHSVLLASMLIAEAVVLPAHGHSRAVAQEAWLPGELEAAEATDLQGHGRPVPVQLPSAAGAVWDQSVGLAEVDGRPWAGGPGFTATFDTGAVAFVPHLGASADEQLPLGFEFLAYGRGGADEIATAAEPVARDLTVDFVRKGVVERYEVRKEGLYQSFVFAEPLNGTGDLVVRGRFATELAGVQVGPDEVVFGRDGLGGVRYGGVLGIDAAGETVAGQLHLDGNEVVLSLPAEFVDRAAYPLVLDPLLSVFTVAAVDSEIEPDVAYDESNDEYLVVWGRRTAGSNEVVGQRVSSSGALLGGMLPIETFEGWDPAVGNVNLTNAFLVVWTQNVDPGPAPTLIYGRTVTAGTGALSGPFGVQLGDDSDEFKADVAGDRTLGSNRALVVFEQRDFGATTGTIQGVSVSVTAGADPVPHTIFDIGTGSDPAVSKSGGSARDAMVVWEGGSEIAARGVSLDGTLLGPSFSVSNLTSLFEAEPDVDGDGSNWLVAYQGQVDLLSIERNIYCRPVTASGTNGLVRVVEAGTGISNDEIQPAVGFGGLEYLVAWSEPNGLFMRSLLPDGLAGCEPKTTISGLSSKFAATQIATEASGSASLPGSRAMLVWQTDPDPFGGGNVTAALWDVQAAPSVAITVAPDPLVCLGGTLELVAEGEGIPAPTYSWFRDGIFTGVTGTTFVKAAALGDTGTYTVQATNSCGTATSGPVTVLVTAPPAITADPEDVVACPGDFIFFTVLADTFGQAATYQWFKDDVALVDGVDFVGVATNTLVVQNVDASDAGSYRVEVATACGLDGSAPANLTVATAPTIVDQPDSLSVCQGQPALFEVAVAAGPLPETYQWRRDGIDLPGETGPQLAIASAQPSDAGDYDVRIEVAGCSGLSVVSAAAALEIGAQPPIATWIGRDGGLFVDAANWDSCLAPSEGALLENDEAVPNRAVVASGDAPALQSMIVAATGAGSQVVAVEAGGSLSADVVDVLPGGALELRGSLPSMVVDNSAGLEPTGALPMFMASDPSACPPAGICLQGGSLGSPAGDLTNGPTGLIYGSGSIEGGFVNNGVLGVNHGLMTTGAVVNEGSILIFDGSTLSAPAVVGSGTLDTFGSGACVPCESGPQPPVLDVNGPVSLTADARINFAGRIEVSGDWDVAAAAGSKSDLTGTVLQLDGISLFGSGQKVEAIGADVGAVDNYGAPVAGAFAQVVIGPNPSAVEIVDNYDNDGDGQPDALYASSMTVAAGANLALNGCTLYVENLVLENGAGVDLTDGALLYGSVTPADPCAPGSGINVAGCGGLQPMPPADCNGNGVADAFEIASGASLDCNGNGVPDECDFALGFSLDLDGNGVPDECQAFHVDQAELSLAKLDRQAMFLHPGVEFAGRPYLILGSLSGTSPGTPYGGLQVPLNLDAYTILALQLVNQLPFEASFGVLDGAGQAEASFQLFDGLVDASAIGLKLYHAFLVDPLSPSPALASNPVSLQIVP